MKGRQLPLGVRLEDAASLDGFHAGPNTAVVAALRATLTADATPAVFLYGAPGSGKSHLLQSLAREALRLDRRCAYLPLSSMTTDGPGVLEGLEHLDLVAIDDAEAFVGDPAWAVELLRLSDRLRSHGRVILWAARPPPGRLAVALPDLATRLAAAMPLGIRPLRDEDRAELLRLLARRRGLDLERDATRYLLGRLPRDTAALARSMELLDQASLSAGRRLTVPFLQRWMREQAPA